MTALPAPFCWRGDDIHAAFDGGEVLFTTKRGAPTDRDTNRERIGLLPGVPRRILWGMQVHGTTVLRDAHPGIQSDGQVTVKPDVGALVFTADCLPIALVADGAVAMLHGGWRGLSGGIVRAGVNVLRHAGATGPITAALGPGARGCCYEVGDAVHASFAAYGARRGERNLALEVVVAAQLADCGVEQVHDTGLCTMCSDADLFFSHRRDRATGRMGSLAWRV